MTSYGTIPTSSAPGPSTNLEYLSRAKERIKAGLGTRRPWKLMFNFRALGLPSSLADVFSRVRTNVGFFRMNYAIIVLLILFLSLLWHPISLIVFVVMMAVWLFLYFLRDEPLAIFNRTIDDRVVLIVLAVLTVVFLLLTKATLNILVALLIGVVLVLVHAVVRRTDDLFLDEEAAGLMTGVGGSPGSIPS
ncbi:PRA1 family protein F3-like [Juglans microcarpa x Juglans regia]|uniref:PRA1 family protein F3-like n=1 Tax=Juglans microcarpa x Juglans regia TaxID=2249226 RepID=UPI001B7F2078|nr:PRA1 family protein F3-like [Juglans microcarpa x Juglans regia]